MASVFHISEEEAARDFGALIRRVRSGEEIVVEESGRPVVIMKAAEDPAAVRGRTAVEILEGLARWEAEHGPLLIDTDFAGDVAEAHERMNQPLDSSKWD
jgi:antitoxin (DNA-binding transcriptional repressor) of toxin-antitoxin stability system